MGKQRIILILAGTVGMFLLMLLRKKEFPKVAFWKLPLVSIFLTIAGVAGTMLMYFIETGRFGGTSFFGAILFVPILMLPVLLLRISFSDLMDLCAPAECLMLAIMKVDCLIGECCIGKYLPSLGFQFPSQIIEMITILFVMMILILAERHSKHKGKLYPYYLLLYGATRFILNWFRYGLTPFVWVLPAGNFWSLVAIAFGLLWLLVLARNKKTK